MRLVPFRPGPAGLTRSVRIAERAVSYPEKAPGHVIVVEYQDGATVYIDAADLRHMAYVMGSSE